MAWEWVARIGGYAAAPFTGGASIPVGEAIAQGISSHKAAGKAEEQLQGANQQAVDLYGQALGPFVQQGQQASNTLGGLMGFAPAPAGAPGGLASMGRSTTGATMYPNGTTGRIRPPDAPVTGQAQARPGSLGQMAIPSQTASSYRTVRMMAPDGSQEDVPEAEAAIFERAGARRVG
jgi:hypothetical protein